jgi:hypothetical protein
MLSLVMVTTVPIMLIMQRVPKSGQEILSIRATTVSRYLRLMVNQVLLLLVTMLRESRVSVARVRTTGVQRTPIASLAIQVTIPVSKLIRTQTMKIRITQLILALTLVVEAMYTRSLKW